MSEVNQKIIQMIQYGATANEISQAVGITNKQLFYRLHMLQIKGYEFLKKYYYDGEIGYQLCKNIQNEKSISLLTKPEDTVIEMVLISDLHLAHNKERIDRLDKIYEFCGKKGIHIIVNGGDIIDGINGNIGCKKIKIGEEQIEYLLKNHPHDKNIINFVCLGNHDRSILKNLGLNLENILSIYRHDIVSLGYNFGKLKIKNDEIVVRHGKNGPRVDSRIELLGHTHRFKDLSYEGHVIIALPTVSDLNRTPFLPGFIKATIYFEQGVIKLIVFEQYNFLDRMHKVNEFSYEIYNNNNMEIMKIANEENRVPYHIRVKS